MESKSISNSDVGQRLLPNVIDDLAYHEPERVLYEEYSDGACRKTTCRNFANAINRVAWWLEAHLGRGSPDCKTVGYYGPDDIRYLVLVVAAMKAGYAMLLVSPRNSMQGNIALFEATQCDVWLQPLKGGNIDNMPERKMRKAIFPEIDEVLDSDAVEHYPYHRDWTTAQNDPGWILHTSGSTGLPKPVRRTIGSASIVDTYRFCGPVDGRRLLTSELMGKKIFLTLPLFHSLGLTMGLHWPVFYNQTIIRGPLTPVTSSTICPVLDVAKPDVLFSSPSTLEELSEEPEAMARLERLDAVAFGGGPLAEKAGNVIAQKTRVILLLGASEAGWLPALETDREDWNYIHFHPNAGLELRPHSQDLYQLFIVKNPKLAMWQTIFTTFQNVEEYCFGDLFSKHPSKPDLWRHEGRADNIIVLSSGEKFSPYTLETLICKDPLIRSALVSGYGRFQTSAIIEVTDTARSSMRGDRDLLDAIWPTIEFANKSVDAHGRLQEEFVMLSSPAKPFLRAGKGTVQKALTLELYKKELDALYLTAEDGDPGEVQFDGLDSCKLQVEVIRLIDLISGKKLGGNEDFFERGIDSLQVLILLRKLRVGLRDSFSLVDPSKSLSSKLIYSNPTAERLSNAITGILKSSTGAVASETSSTTSEMQDMLDKYLQRLPQNSGPKETCPVEGKIVLLTGSTGSLGSYILDALLSSPDVKEIWCLNRTADAEERQSVAGRSRGLRTSWDKDNVRFLCANLSKPNLGLEEATYWTLLSRTMLIIHNAWRVDFNLGLSSFESQVEGVLNLLEFASNAHHENCFVFISSVGVFQNWKASTAVSETSMIDLAVASRGYGKSKLIGERLVEEATRRGLVTGKIARLGQIAGPVKNGTKGSWNASEWIPTLIRASMNLGELPSSIGKFDSVAWIPVDLMAQIVIELSHAPVSLDRSPSFFNVVNPHKSLWSSVARAIQQQVQGLKLVPLEEWKLNHRQAVETARDLDEVPGTQLLDFFDKLATNDSEYELEIETTQSSLHSLTLREIGCVSDRWADLWMRQFERERSEQAFGI